MADALTAINPRRPPRSQQADPRQVKNNAGGYAFEVSDDTRIHRFLTIGTDGGTYYASESELTQDNARVVLDAARVRGKWLVEQIVAISTAGRAPRQNPAIFALAAVAGLGDEAARKAALEALPAVCRIGTHLFLFARYVEQFRGWGRGLRTAVGNWYLNKSVDDLAYQVCKYRQREGWSHRDLLRLAHPETEDMARKGLFDWICGRDPEYVVPLVSAFEAARTMPAGGLPALIRSHSLSWEMLPDAALGEPKVWHALIEKGMPQTALMRQLPRLTRLGVLKGSTLKKVTAQLADPDRLREARIHPINILLAQRTYASGHSARGDASWTPKRKIVDALDEAYYGGYQTVEPAGKRTLLALDVSGSMGERAGGLPITCREVSAALALVTMSTEPECDVVGFTSGSGASSSGWGRSRNTAITELPLSPRQRLDDAVRSVANLPFGATDCSLPMTWAAKNNREYDTIVVLTDSETWFGDIHPHQALTAYRNVFGIPTRLIVVGLTATNISIAEPRDPGSLDIAGMDSAVPNLISDFSRGSI